MESPENNPTAKKETSKIDDISSQINLSPGSEAHKQFARLMKETGANSNRDLVILLMNNYENPPQDSDSATTIMNLEREVANLKAENQAYDATIQNLETENQQLKDQLETSRNEANENARRGNLQQTQLDELRQRVNDAIILKLDPTTLYFIRKIADETKTDPARMIAKLLWYDIQNPNANHWPADTPSSREFKHKFEELKPKQN